MQICCGKQSQKVYTVKSSNPAKSSEWRAIRNKLVESFPALQGFLAGIPKAFLERIQFSTEKHVGSLYFNNDDDALIALSPVEDTLMPSLVTAWQVPNCVPVILTHAPVMEKICHAADLMAPGITGDLPTVQPGDVVGVAIHTNPALVLALGVALMSTDQITRERKGKAVRIIHYVGDTLWERCGKPKPKASLTKPPPPPPQEKSETVEESQPQSEEEIEEIEVVSMSQGLDDVHLDEEKEASPDFQETEPIGDDGLTPDQLAINALVHAIPIMETPISASTLHSKYLQPHAKGLNFKDTKWKKIAKFLKQMEKDEKLITTKEIKGEVHVMTANTQHSLVQEVASSSTPSKKNIQRPNNENFSQRQQNTATNNAKSNGKVDVRPLFQPIAALSFAFPKKDAILSRQEVSAALEEYYVKNGLESPLNRRFVSLDPYLTKYAGNVPEDVREVRRDDILQNVLKAMKKLHIVVTKENPKGQVRKGEFPRITVTVEKRQGRKLVTIIKNLNQLFSLPDLQQEFSVKCASSVSIADNQILCQGQHTKFLQEWARENGVGHLIDFIQK